MSDLHQAPERIRNLALPDGDGQIGRSVRALERELEQVPHGGQLLDLTYADTHRFPAPSWVLPDFSAAAEGGGMTYTPYRGDRTVRSAIAESLSGFLGVNVNPDTEVILTPGTQAALFGALACVVEQGDTVALGDPGRDGHPILMRQRAHDAPRPDRRAGGRLGRGGGRGLPRGPSPLRRRRIRGRPGRAVGIRWDWPARDSLAGPGRRCGRRRRRGARRAKADGRPSLRYP